MNDPNFIRIDVSGGWLEQLIMEIDRNREFALWGAESENTSDENRYIYKNMVERDERVKAKVTKYTDSSGCARLYRSEYQDILHILLENSVARKNDNEVINND